MYITEKKYIYIYFLEHYLYTLQIGGNKVPMSHQVKILEVMLDSAMTLHSDIAAKCRSSYSYYT